MALPVFIRFGRSRLSRRARQRKELDVQVKIIWSLISLAGSLNSHVWKRWRRVIEYDKNQGTRRVSVSLGGSKNFESHISLRWEVLVELFHYGFVVFVAASRQSIVDVIDIRASLVQESAAMMWSPQSSRSNLVRHVFHLGPALQSSCALNSGKSGSEAMVEGVINTKIMRYIVLVLSDRNT
jgi:F0F1-type ATP synthase gamma subunit